MITIPPFFSTSQTTSRRSGNYGWETDYMDIDEENYFNTSDDEDDNVAESTSTQATESPLGLNEESLSASSSTSTSESLLDNDFLTSTKETSSSEDSSSFNEDFQFTLDTSSSQNNASSSNVEILANKIQVSPMQLATLSCGCDDRKIWILFSVGS